MRKEPKVQLVELFDFARGFGAVEGIERDLRERRWRGTLAGVGAVIVQVATLAASKDYLSRVGHFFANLFSGNWDKLIGGEQGLDIYQLLAVGLLVAGGAAFPGLRNTHLLLPSSPGALSLYVLGSPVPARRRPADGSERPVVEHRRRPEQAASRSDQSAQRQASTPVVARPERTSDRAATTTGFTHSRQRAVRLEPEGD